MPAENISPTRKPRKTLGANPSRWTVADIKETQNRDDGGLAPARRARSLDTGARHSDPDEGSRSLHETIAAPVGGVGDWAAEREEEAAESRAIAKARSLAGWSSLPLLDRQEKLREAVAKLFRRRFGFDFRAEDHLRRYVADAPALGRYAATGKPNDKARKASARSRFVALFDRVNMLGLEKFKDEPWRGPSRFLSVVELTWISFLGGNWPTTARDRRPLEVLRAEREHIRKTLKRHGQRPKETLEGSDVVRWKIRRGKQAHARQK